MRLASALLIVVAAAPEMSAQQIRLPRHASLQELSARALSKPLPAPPPRGARGGSKLPTWVRWGLVGGAVGAVGWPLISGLASDSQHDIAREAVGGAVGGFVLVGGSIFVWQQLCDPDMESRRDGMCGRQRAPSARHR